jgi:hypothetical protein
MSTADFGSAIPVSEQLKNYAFFRSATEIGE